MITDNSRHRIVLGIDPGTARLGFGVIRFESAAELIDHGAIETGPGQPMPERLLFLFQQLEELVREHEPDVLAVEQVYFARNVTTAITVGQARGVVLLVAARNNIPVVEYTPSEVKHAIAGYGKADKAQIQEMIRLILALDHTPQPDDAADALAIAVCHAHHASGYGVWS